MSHDERIEKVLRPSAQKCIALIRAKYPNSPKPKTLMERRMIEIEEAKKDGCSLDYIEYLVAKLRPPAAANLSA